MSTMMLTVTLILIFLAGLLMGATLQREFDSISFLNKYNPVYLYYRVAELGNPPLVLWFRPSLAWELVEAQRAVLYGGATLTI